MLTLNDTMPGNSLMFKPTANSAISLALLQDSALGAPNNRLADSLPVSNVIPLAGIYWTSLG
jgi:hypothetical protein